MKQLSIACALTLALMNFACGTRSLDPTPPGQAQGLYLGSDSNGLMFETIILPDGQFYGFYGTQSGNVLAVSGMIVGQGFAQDGHKYFVTGSDVLANGAIHSATIISSYKIGLSLAGQVTVLPGDSFTFAGTVPSTSRFNYNTPAVASDIEGNWLGILPDGPADISISSGTFSGADSGCLFSGTIVPNASGKNFFDVSLTYGNSPCAKPNQSESGIAVDYLLSDGVTRQLVIGVLGASSGTTFVANR